MFSVAEFLMEDAEIEIAVHLFLFIYLFYYISIFTPGKHGIFFKNIIYLYIYYIHINLKI